MPIILAHKPLRYPFYKNFEKIKSEIRTLTRNFGLLFSKVNMKKLSIHGWAQQCLQNTVDVFNPSNVFLTNQLKRQSNQFW